MDHGMDYYLLTKLAINLGYELAMCGAETFRVEETVNRVLDAYGIEAEVFAIPNCIHVSFETTKGKPMTRMRRIGYHGTDLAGVERFNALSRRICAEKPEPEVAKMWLKEARKNRWQFPLWAYLLGNAIGASGFAIFFGGNLTDSLLAGICGISVGIVSKIMDKLKVNQFFSTVLASLVQAFLAYTMAGFGLTEHVDAIIIGTLMILVPGLLFTNAMRDILYGDTTSGVNRIAMVVLIAVAIALGTAAAWTFTNLLWPYADNSVLLCPGFIQCLASLFGCIGFAILFNVNGMGIQLGALGGFLTWASYLVAVELGCSPVFANFWAALFSATYSEVMARIRKSPAIGYLAVSIFPLLPGAGIYYTMDSALRGLGMYETLEKALETAFIAGNLALGILLASTCFRVYANLRAKQKAKA